MRGSRKFCQRGSKYDFLVDGAGIEDPNTAINGPSSIGQPANRHRNGVSLAGR